MNPVIAFDPLAGLPTAMLVLIKEGSDYREVARCLREAANYVEDASGQALNEVQRILAQIAAGST